MQLRCDVHTHTLYSRHAYSTILENVRSAKEAGLELLGSTDHFSSMLYPEYENIRHYQYLCVSHTWPKEIDGVRLLQGCEVDIVDLDGHLFGYDIPIAKNIDGDFYNDKKTLSLYERVTRKMDYVIASVHKHSFADSATPLECTKLYLEALRNKKVLILGHIGRSGPLKLIRYCLPQRSPINSLRLMSIPWIAAITALTVAAPLPYAVQSYRFLFPFPVMPILLFVSASWTR